MSVSSIAAHSICETRILGVRGQALLEPKRDIIARTLIVALCVFSFIAGAVNTVIAIQYTSMELLTAAPFLFSVSFLLFTKTMGLDLHIEEDLKHAVRNVTQLTYLKAGKKYGYEKIIQFDLAATTDAIYGELNLALRNRKVAVTNNNTILETTHDWTKSNFTSREKMRETLYADLGRITLEVAIRAITICHKTHDDPLNPVLMAQRPLKSGITGFSLNSNSDVEDQSYSESSLE